MQYYCTLILWVELLSPMELYLGTYCMTGNGGFAGNIRLRMLLNGSLKTWPSLFLQQRPDSEQYSSSVNHFPHVESRCMRGPEGWVGGAAAVQVAGK